VLPARTLAATWPRQLAWLRWWSDPVAARLSRRPNVCAELKARAFPTRSSRARPPPLLHARDLAVTHRAHQHRERQAMPEYEIDVTNPLPIDPIRSVTAIDWPHSFYCSQKNLRHHHEITRINRVQLPWGAGRLGPQSDRSSVDAGETPAAPRLPWDGARRPRSQGKLTSIQENKKLVIWRRIE